jgi:hypothetical protein
MKARALWTVAPGVAEIRDHTLPTPAEAQALVITRASGISRGTESVCWNIQRSRADRLVTWLFARSPLGTLVMDPSAARMRLERGPIEITTPRAVPKAMLSHPKGGALAVIGHVERAWSCSFLDGKSSTQTSTFVV